jgi:hypothetical protein
MVEKTMFLKEIPRAEHGGLCFVGERYDYFNPTKPSLVTKA